MSVRSGVTDIVIPQPLNPGATIGICAPAGPVNPERMNRAIAALESEGYGVAASPSAFGKQGLFAAADTVRLRELEDMFTRSDIDAIFCARGGVGSSRLLNSVDTGRLAGSRKPFLGFSDITALQWFLWARERFVTFSGPLAVEWDGSLSDITRLHAVRMLSGTASPNLLDGFTLDSVQVLSGSRPVTGRLMPGNLTMITTLLGTPFMPDLRDTILLIEDVNEAPHRVDRMLFHLKNAGALNHIAALLVGDLISEDDQDNGEIVKTSLMDVMKDRSIPIVMNLPYGHGAERMTLPVGGMVEFDTEGMTLRMIEPVVGEPAV